MNIFCENFNEKKWIIFEIFLFRKILKNYDIFDYVKAVWKNKLKKISKI